MTARRQYDFEENEKMMAEGGYLPYPGSNGRIPQMPNSFEDLIKTDGFAYNEWLAKQSGDVKTFVDAIVRGDLETLKKMNSKTVDDFLNRGVVSGEHIIRGLPPEGYVFGVTPLMIAAMCGKTDVMRWLMDLGADIGMKSKFEKNEFLSGCTAADYLRHYKALEDKRRAEELNKQKERDELNDLMDEVDGKKILDQELPRPKSTLDDMLRAEVDRIRAQEATKVDGPIVNKVRRKGQLGNGKGIDDLIERSQEKSKKMGHALDNQTKYCK